MHIYFSGIGGAGIGPLALIAKQAGYTVSGSDKQSSSYLEYLQEHGITDIHVGQTTEAIAAVHDKNPIDWLVYSSALPKEQPNHPEILFAATKGIKATKRDEFTAQYLQDTDQIMIAIAGTHGKTTTTAMAVWLLLQLGEPISYLLPAKTSFASLGHHDKDAKYFVYECDEYDRNFLSYNPGLSLVTGIDWDHPDIYPTRESYNEAFRQFLKQSERSVMWQPDAELISTANSETCTVLDPECVDSFSSLPGRVNRQNAVLAAEGLVKLFPERDMQTALDVLNHFPGVSRRFEMVQDGLYTDYAHTPPKIAGAIQIGTEHAGSKLVVIYEGLHNTRQHFIKDDLLHLFDEVKRLYVVPSYLAREDPNLALLSPSDIIALTSREVQQKASPAALNEELISTIKAHIADGDTVLCLTAGGGGSLDEWLRKHFAGKVAPK